VKGDKMQGKGRWWKRGFNAEASLSLHLIWPELREKNKCSQRTRNTRARRTPRNKVYARGWTRCFIWLMGKGYVDRKERATVAMPCAIP